MSTNRTKHTAFTWWRSLSTAQHIKLINWHWPSSSFTGTLKDGSKIERMWQLEGNPNPLTYIKRTNEEYD
jgi:hypothetical protein